MSDSTSGSGPGQRFCEICCELFTNLDDLLAHERTCELVVQSSLHEVDAGARDGDSGDNDICDEHLVHVLSSPTKLQHDHNGMLETGDLCSGLCGVFVNERWPELLLV